MRDHASYTKLRTKLALLMSALIALISLFLIWYLPERMLNSARGSLVDTATSVAALSAHGLAETIGTGEPPASAPILRALRENSDLVFLVVTDLDGKVLASFNERLADQVEYEAILPADRNQATPAGKFNDDGRIYQTVATIRQQGRPVGHLHLGLSMDRHLAGVARARDAGRRLDLAHQPGRVRHAGRRAAALAGGGGLDPGAVDAGLLGLDAAVPGHDPDRGLGGGGARASHAGDA
ncbi:MAG: hypothetical protein KY432_10015, partial [Acidobacteria bacterium]|nr:hypothetical protein [Acidobacteriota bacterium]